VYCQLEALRHCLPPSVRRILEELPETLDETYERVLREINRANREYARRLLQCIAVAVRPLRVVDLAEVLAIDFDAPAHGGIPLLNPDWRWADQHQAVLSTCSSLVTVVDDGNSHEVVQFSHFSVKEFLLSDRLARSSRDVSIYHIVLEPAHTTLVQACLGVLLRLDDRVCTRSVYDKWRDKPVIPLVYYASEHWVDHARFENVLSRIRDAMEYFFDAHKPHWTAWCYVNWIDPSWTELTPHHHVPNVAFPLYFASLCGFYDLVEHLLGKHPEHINARGGRMLAPLVVALRRKHFQVAELLHRNGADVDFRAPAICGPVFKTLLGAACHSGDLKIVEWLLNHGVDVNAHYNEGDAPLHEAVDYGHLQILQMLIKHNADVHIRGRREESPLHLAACRSRNPHSHGSEINRDLVDFMQVLLDHGADPNARDIYNATPLHHSSWWKRVDYTAYRHGSVEGARLLLKYGAIIDAEDNEGKTPLQLALEHGRHDMVACLKEHGATR
jgi:ankyrin repeat protein